MRYDWKVPLRTEDSVPLNRLAILAIKLYHALKKFLQHCAPFCGCEVNYASCHQRPHSCSTVWINDMLLFYWHLMNKTFYLLQGWMGQLLSK
jgi:hypothetical protein